MTLQDKEAIDNFREMIRRLPDSTRIVRMGQGEFTPMEILGHMVNAAEGANDPIGKEELETHRRYMVFKKNKEKL